MFHEMMRNVLVASEISLGKTVTVMYWLRVSVCVG
jgi:hypothetical protein